MTGVDLGRVIAILAFELLGGGEVCECGNPEIHAKCLCRSCYDQRYYATHLGAERALHMAYAERVHEFCWLRDYGGEEPEQAAARVGVNGVTTIREYEAIYQERRAAA